MPESSVRLLLLQESHSGGLMGHFGREMTLLMLDDVGRPTVATTSCVSPTTIGLKDEVTEAWRRR